MLGFWRHACDIWEAGGRQTFSSGHRVVETWGFSAAATEEPSAALSYGEAVLSGSAWIAGVLLAYGLLTPGSPSLGQR